MQGTEAPRAADAPPEEMTSLGESTAQSVAGKVPAHFYQWFWGLAAVSALLLAIYLWRMDGEQFEILKELSASVVPLGVLTFVVLAVILFGICTATESAAIGALGAMYLAVMTKYLREVLWWSLVGALIGVALGWYEGEDFASLLVAASIGGTLVGTVVPGLWNLRASPELRAEHEGSDVSHGQNDCDGVLAVHRLGAFLRRVRAARRPRINRALGAWHELVAVGILVYISNDHFLAWLAARMD